MRRPKSEAVTTTAGTLGRRSRVGRTSAAAEGSPDWGGQAGAEPPRGAGSGGPGPGGVSSEESPEPGAGLEEGGSALISLCSSPSAPTRGLLPGSAAVAHSNLFSRRFLPSGGPGEASAHASLR